MQHFMKTSETLKTPDILAIFFKQILPAHRVAGLQSFLLDANAKTFENVIAIEGGIDVALETAKLRPQRITVKCSEVS